MIVDDHEVVRAGLRTLLQAEPDIQIVAEAATGGQALIQAARVRPQIVLLDARLPDMAGRTSVGRCTKHCQLSWWPY